MSTFDQALQAAYTYQQWISALIAPVPLKLESLTSLYEQFNTQALSVIVQQSRPSR